MGTLFCCRFLRWGFLFPLQFIDNPDQKKNRKSYNDEAYDRIGEQAAVDGDRTRLLSFNKSSIGGSGSTLFQHDK
jgi:hypothetical protein